MVNHEVVEGESCKFCLLIEGQLACSSAKRKDFKEFNIFEVVSDFTFLVMHLHLLMGMWEDGVVGQ